MSEENKFEFFRDLRHEDNLEDGKSHHSAGIVLERHAINSPSGKDLLVQYLDPFNLAVITCWRGDDDVELFDGTEHDWKEAKRSYAMLEDTIDKDVKGEKYFSDLIAKENKYELVTVVNKLFEDLRTVLRLMKQNHLMVRGINVREYSRPRAGWNVQGLIESLLLLKSNSFVRIYDTNGRLNYLRRIDVAMSSDLRLEP